MNAAERLWRGLARHDWEAVHAQFHTSAQIERVGGPSSGTRVGVDEFLDDHRAELLRNDVDVELLRAFSDGTTALVEARVGSARCAGIYDLRDGRITGATEYWA